MKNVLKSFAAFIFAALAISSCANSELVPETPKGPTHTVKFTSGVPETKTDMDIDPDSKAVTYTWTDEDLNRLDVYENGVKGTIDTENSSITATSLVIYATFDGGETTEPKEYTAVLNGVVGNQTPRVDENSYDEDADVLVAKPITATAAEGIEFQFRRAVAVNKMNLLDLPVGETLSTVTITSDKPISGIIDGNDWSEELLEYTIELSVNKEIPANGKLTLYYMAIPVDGAILTVDAKIGTDSYLKKFDKTLTTEAGNVKGYSVGLKKMETKIYTLTFNSFTSGEQTISSTTKASTFITEGTTYVTAQPFSDVSNCFYGGDNTNGKPLRVGKSGGAGSITMALSDEGKAKATKIILSAKQYSNGKTQTIGIFDSEKQQPGNGYTDLTFNLDGSEISKITLKSDGYIYVRSLTVESYGEAEPAINAEDISNVVAAGVTDATFNFSVVNIIGTPTATPDGVIVTDASANGNTVTYTVSKNETYAPREGSIIIKVGEESKTVLVSQLGIVPDYEGEGTLESPYTVADALLKIETLEPGTSSEKVYVAGPIKSIDSFNSTYGSITYVIGEGETTLDIFGGLDFGGNKFSAESDISEGQTVVVYGSLKDYSGTKEMDSNNELVSVNGKTYLLKSISVTGAKDKFDQGDSFSNEGATVTAYYRGSKENTTVTDYAIFSGYDGTKLGLQDITVSYTEDDITKTTTYQVSVANATPISINVADYDSSKGKVTVTAGGVPVTEAKIGTEIVVTVTTETGFVVDEFTVNGQAQTLTNGVYQFTMSEDEVTIAVTFKEKPAGYERITELSDITSASYVIAAKVGEKYYAMPTTFAEKPTGAEITVTDNVIEASDATDYIWTVSKTGDTYTFSKDGSNLGYKSSTNWQKDGDNTTFNIALGTSTATGMIGGTFAVKNISSSRLILYNGTVFGAYTDGQTSNSYYYVELFKLEDKRTPQPNFGFSASAGSYDLFTKESTYPTLEGALTTVTYQSSDESVATVDNGGTIHPIKVGTTVITATTSENDPSYKPAKASYTLTITDSTPILTLNVEEVNVNADEMTNATISNAYSLQYATDNDVTVGKDGNITDASISGGTVTYSIKANETETTVQSHITLTLNNVKHTITVDQLGAGATPTIERIEWTGYTVDYYVNENFKKDGVVTAYYSNGSNKVVTESDGVVFSSPDMSTVANNVEVTVSYEGVNTIGHINVKAKSLSVGYTFKAAGLGNGYGTKTGVAEDAVSKVKWTVTFGQATYIGTNSSNKSKCKLGDTYAKVGTPLGYDASTTQVAAIISESKLDGVAKVVVSGDTDSYNPDDISIVYSTDGNTYSLIEKQNYSKANGNTFTFSAKSAGFYAVVLHYSGDSYMRTNSLKVEFYK